MPPTYRLCSSAASASSNSGRSAARKADSRAPSAGLVEAAAQPAAAELEAGDAVVQVLRRPVDEAGVDGLAEAEDPLRDAAGRGDHDDHHDLRLEQQHLDVAHGRRPERRRRDEREQPRQLGEHLGRRLQRGVDLVARGRQVEREARPAAGRAARAAGRRSSGSRARSARARPRCAGASAGRAARARPARCARSTPRRRARRARAACASRPAAGWRRTPRRRRAGSSAGGW